MKVNTENKKLMDVFPDLAGKFAQKWHKKKEDIPYIKKFYSSESFDESKDVSKDERSITSYITTSSVDRDLEILDPKGMVTDNYKKSGSPVFWGHSYSSPDHVIGRNLWLTPSKEGDKILAKTAFRKSQFADEVYKLYTEKIDGEPILKGWSVGFIPIEWEDHDEKSNNGARRTYNKWELLEYSAVPIPSNADSLTLAYKKGMITSKRLKKDLEITIEDKDPEITIEGEEKEIHTKPETTEDYHRIPVSIGHDGHKIRTIDVSKEQKIKALYCVDCKEIVTYLFDTGTWTMEEARDWVDEHKDIQEMEVKFDEDEQAVDELDDDIEGYQSEDMIEGEEAEEKNIELEDEELRIQDAGEEKQETFTCECIECGHTLETEEHCKDIKCPECGGKMRRKERPGPGRSIDIETDDVKKVITINGLKYSYEMFDAFSGGFKLNEPFMIIEREDGTITVEKYDKDDKVLKAIAELKEGRVLSSRNRKVVKDAIEASETAIDALRKLYEATEPPERDEQPKNTGSEDKDIVLEKDATPEAEPETKEQIIEKAISKALSPETIAKIIEQKVDEKIKRLKGKIG